MATDGNRTDTYWPAAAFASLRASRWRLFLARLFGERVEGHDAECTVIGYRYRGVLYMTECKRNGC